MPRNVSSNAQNANLGANLQSTVDTTFSNALQNQGGSFGLANNLGDTAFNDVAGSELGSVGLPSATELGDIGDLGHIFSSAGGGAAAGAGAAAAGGAAADLGGGLLAGGELTGLTAAGAGGVTADAAAAAAVDAAAGGAGAGGALGAIGAIAPYAIPALAAGYGLYELFSQPETKETITNKNEPNSSTIQLQSGNSALLVGNSPNPTSGVAFGAGTSRGQGSAQWFLVPQGNARLGNGPSVTKGTPFWIGGQASQDLTNFANSVPLSGGKPDFSSYIAQYQQNPKANTGLVGVFNNNGGQATWGMTYPQWLQAVWSAKNGVTGNLST